jgi:threonine dehydratase
MTVTLDDIRRAADLIRDSVIHTPCVLSRTLSEISGAEIYLKLENLQFTGSFKDRGALVKLSSLSEAERKTGVIAASAGNHAQAVAHHARNLGIPAIIVMPRFTPNIKVQHTRAFGAEVVLHGEHFDEARDHAQELAADRGLCMIPPFDDAAIIAGQGTIALEILEDCPGFDTVVVPVGGGGLISGIATALKQLQPATQVIGVETERFPAVADALDGKSPRFGNTTIAEGIAVKQPGTLTLDIIRNCVDRMLLVDEDSTEEAVLLLLEVEKTVAEGAGAVPLAALLRHRPIFADRRVCLVISGGNIDLPVLSDVIQRGLVRSQRLVRLYVDLRDVAGTLGEAASIIGSSGAKIVQVNHHRAFTTLPLDSVEVEFVIQTRGPDHVEELMALLKSMGYHAQKKERQD